MQALQRREAFLAGFWASLLILLVGAVIISFIDNDPSLIAAMLGCFIGTYIDTKIRQRDVA
jgi:hypothetical protein